MHRGLPEQKVLSFLVMVSLALLTLLGSVTGPPEVAMSDVSKIDGGETIRVRGIVVDAWDSDAGVLSLVLADLDTQSSLKALCTNGIMAAPAAIHIGDEVRVTGEIETTGGRPILWSSRDDVELLRLSREALTLEALAGAWELLVGDRFEVVGILVPAEGGGEFRLMDMGRSLSIAFEPPQADMTRFEERKVIVDVVLRLRPQTMELVLVAYGISLSS
jgi:hypothetical protein